MGLVGALWVVFLAALPFFKGGLSQVLQSLQSLERIQSLNSHLKPLNYSNGYNSRPVRTGRHDSRLAWWAVHASSCILYQAVARPLLSVRVTGSMTVERVAKPLNNRVMTKERSRLSSEKSSMLLRVGLNLRFLQASKSKLWDSDDEWEKTPVPQTPQPARYYLEVKEAARRQQHFLYVSSTKTKTAERQVMKCNKSIIIASSLVLVVCCSLIYLVFIFYEMLMPSSEWVRSSNSKIEKPSCDRYKYKYNEV